jgi:hypothetical protein
MTKLREEVLDTFEDLSGWKAVTSGQAELRIFQGRGLRAKPSAWGSGRILPCLRAEWW